MQITDVRIRRIDNDTTLKGEAAVTIGGDLAIHGIKIVEGKNGLFLSMPNRKGKDKDGNDKYFDIVHPTTSEARKQINDMVLNAFKAMAPDAADNTSDGDEA